MCMNPEAGKMKQILCSDWIGYLSAPSCLGFPVLVPQEEMSLFGQIKSHLLTKFVWSRKLDICLALLYIFIDLNLASVYNI